MNKELTYATTQSAGLDLRSEELTALTIEPNGTLKIDTGKVPVPAFHVGFVMPKSGLSVNHNIVARIGVIDADYTGNIIVTLDNFGSEPYTFQPGDKVAQLVVVPMVQLDGFRVEDKERGEGGFGSTGR